ncbi:Mediator of RNA polymerase II transcription subunit 10 [Blyttiomyces sp. JEL0837]|nr:Mediator of RNA polymerase II transcription subunit 10 [Blyttiomyces sp. JEL0837]
MQARDEVNGLSSSSTLPQQQSSSTTSMTATTLRNELSQSGVGHGGIGSTSNSNSNTNTNSNPNSGPGSVVNGNGGGTNNENGSDSFESALQNVEGKLEEILHSLFKMGVTVANFQAESGAVLHRRIDEYTSQLADLDSLKDNLDVRVPLEVIDTIESGKNPDQYTRDLMQMLVDKNQKANGRIQTMENFFKELNSELSRNYPELAQHYNEHVEKTSGEKSEDVTMS